MALVVDVAADDANISSTLKIGISSNLATRANIFTQSQPRPAYLVTMNTKINLAFGINPTMHFSA